MVEELIKARIVFDRPNMPGTMPGTSSANYKNDKIEKGVVKGLITFEILKKSLQKLVDASPRLQATISIFAKGIEMILRPIGDVISLVLRPIAMQFLKYGIAFYKKAMDIFFPSAGSGNRGLATAQTATSLAGMGVGAGAGYMAGGGIGAGIGAITMSTIMGAVNEYGEKLGERFGDWIVDVFADAKRRGWSAVVTDAIVNLGKWIGDNISAFMTGVFDLGAWLGGKFAEFIIGVFDLGEWLGGHFVDYISKTAFNLGKWLETNINSFITGIFDVGSWIKSLFMPTKSKSGEITSLTPRGLIDAAIAGTKDLIKNAPRIKDGYISKDGQITRFDDNDNIFASKRSMIGGGGTTNINISINALDAKSIDRNTLNEITRAVTDALQRGVSRRSSEFVGAW